MDIALGTPDDVDALRPLWDEMVEHHRAVAGAFPVRPLDESWTRKRVELLGWFAEDTALVLIARKGDTLLGYLLCELSSSGPIYDLGDRRGDVDSIVVAHQARGAGVGTALLAACKTQLVARGCTHWTIGVADGNDDAQRLYERLGFRPWVLELAAPLL